MRSKACITIILFLINWNRGSAQEQDNKITFNSGENLEFIIYYGIINGGVATMKLRKVIYNGNNALHCYTEARSTGITDRLYKVRDIYESYFNPEDILPYKSIRNINEGKYHKYNEV